MKSKTYNLYLNISTYTKIGATTYLNDLINFPNPVIIT